MNLEETVSAFHVPLDTLYETETGRHVWVCDGACLSPMPGSQRRSLVTGKQLSRLHQVTLVLLMVSAIVAISAFALPMSTSAFGIESCGYETRCEVHPDCSYGVGLQRRFCCYWGATYDCSAWELLTCSCPD